MIMLREKQESLGIPGIIDETGFNDKLVSVAELAAGDACTGSNPRPILKTEMEKLLTCCYYNRGRLLESPKNECNVCHRRKINRFCACGACKYPEEQEIMRLRACWRKRNLTCLFFYDMLDRVCKNRGFCQCYMKQRENTIVWNRIV